MKFVNFINSLGSWYINLGKNIIIVLIIELIIIIYWLFIFLGFTLSILYIRFIKF